MLENQGCLFGIRCRSVYPFNSVWLNFEEIQTADNRPQHGVRLDELYLRGQKLICIIGVGARRLLADRAGWTLAVDIAGRGGVEYRNQPGGDQYGHNYASGDEGEDLPSVALQNPQVVR